MPNAVLFDNIPVDDFLTAYQMHQATPGQGYLPADSQLKEFRISGTVKSRVTEHRIDIFFLNQYDMLSDSTNYFLVFRTDSNGVSDLEKFVKRFRIDLKSQGFEGLFRIDPRYGLIVGSSRNSIDLEARTKPNCFVTLYLTGDAAHPEVSLMEYTDKDNREKYKEVFKAHNGCFPKKKGIFGFDLTSLKKRERKGEVSSLFNYKHLFSFTNALRTRYSMVDISVAFIFSDLNDDDYKLVLLDQTLGTFYPTGQCRFFNSTDELLS